MLKKTLDWLGDNAKTIARCLLVTVGTALVGGLITGIASGIEEATDESE